MSYASEINDALTAATGDPLRARRDSFKINQAWPAVRFTFVSANPGETICGSGGNEESDYRVQVDVVAKTSAERDALRAATRLAITAMPTPASLESWTDGFDTETQAFMATMDFLLHPSSA